MQDIKSSPDNQTSNISTQFFSPKSSVFTRLYQDFHQRTFIQKTQEVVTPQKSVKQEDKYRTKHLMAHIIRRHKEAQDRINELRELKEKELDQFDFKPKILKASREILKNIQQSNENIKKKQDNFIQDPLLNQDTSKISEKQESEDFQFEQEIQKQCEINPPIQNSKEQQKQKKAKQNNQDLDGSELFKNLIEQRKTYFRSLQLHYPGVSTQPCKNHIPECYVNLNTNASVPPYDPFGDINTNNSVEQQNELPSSIGKLNDNALTKTMTQRHGQN